MLNRRWKPAFMDQYFISYPLGQGLLADMRASEFPSQLLGWSGKALPLPPGSTHFGFVHEGNPTLQCAAGEFKLAPGMYFSVNGAGRIDGSGQGIVVSRLGYRGFFQIGGPIEPHGR